MSAQLIRVGVTRPSLAQLTDVEATATAPTDTPLLWRKGVDGQWRPEPAPPFAEDAPAILGELAAHEVRLDGHDEDLDAKANIASPTFTGTVGGVTKAMVGLGSVANLAPADLPVSTATAAAIASAPGAVASVNGATGAVVLTKADVGLGNVTNTSDTAKPVSTAQQAALDAKAPLASPTFTGTVSGVTKAHVGLGNVADTAPADLPVSSAQQAALNTRLAGDLLTPPRYRRLPRKTMQTTFQSGHGWTVNLGTWTVDTADYQLGSQSIRVTAPNTGTGQTYRRLNQPAQDLTNRNFAMLVKVDQPTNLFQIQMYLGTSSLSNFIPLIAGVGGVPANATVPPNEWVWIHFSWADAGSMVGTVDKTVITDWQLRVVSPAEATGPATVWCNAIAHYPKPTTYPNGVVSFAFDDNYINQYTLGRPILDAVGFGATAFVIVESLGSTGSFMTRAQVDELQATHGWEVGGHAFTTAAHNAGFTTLSAADLETEVRSLRDWLRRGAYKGADLFAYPLGDENAAVRGSVGQYFTLARQIVRRPHLPAHLDQPLRVRSHSVSSSDSLSTIQGVVDKAYENGTWLILTFHHLIAGTPTAGTQWPVADFQSLVTYVQNKGIAVETVGQVLDSLR